MSVEQIIVADIGGTHARFALASIAGEKISLSAETTLLTGEYDSLEAAFAAFASGISTTLPKAAAIAVAAPVGGGSVRLTNARWVIDTENPGRTLGLADCLLLNDFAAVAHCVGAASTGDFAHVCGPDMALPCEGIVSIVGPGTGLGVAMLHRDVSGRRIIATEGGHTGFAPRDAFEDRLLMQLRQRYGRVSVERVVSGAGLAAIREAIARDEGRKMEAIDDRALWASALSGTDELASAALERFCMCLGAAAGDIALAHGANAVVIAGGLGQRLGKTLAGTGFAEQFIAKGRYRDLLASLPVKVLTRRAPGLHGAAAAFAARAR